MQFYWFLLGALGVWRVTHLLSFEDGPGDIMARARRGLAQSVLGRVVNCFYCLSVWVALPFAFGLGETWRERGLLWPSLSGAAILVERATENMGSKRLPIYEEDQEDKDHVLRENQKSVSGGSF